MINRLYILMLASLLSILAINAVYSQSIHTSFNTELNNTSIKFSDLKSKSKILYFEIPFIETEEIVIEGKKFNKIAIPGSGLTTHYGLPKLPVFTKFIEVPAGNKLKVEITHLETETLNHLIPEPYQKPQNRNDYLSGVPSEFQIDKDYYSSSQIYPSTYVSLGEPKYLGSNRITDLKINAVRFNPVKNSLEVITKLELKLIFERDKNSVMEGSPIIATNALNKISNSLVERYDSKSRNASEGIVPRMLIITHDDFYHSIQPLAEWKNRQGIKTRVVKLSDLSNKREAEDIKKLITSFLQDSTNMEGLEYVLLVGDVDYIPAFHGVFNALNDHSYVTINENDFLPDLIVGRFSVNTAEECDVYVEKTINYERYVVVNDSSNWFNKAISAASNSHLDDLHGQHVTEEFRVNGFDKVDDLRATKQNFTNYHISNGLNEGRSWMFYIGHGDETAWLTTGAFTRNTIDNSLNYTKSLPAIVSVACSNSDLDFAYGDCFAERFMNTGSEQGAAIFLGATELTPFFLSDTLGKYALFSYLNGESETFGEAMIYGKMKMYEAFTDNTPNSETKETMQHFLILGDPTMMPYTQKPTAITSNRLTQIKPGFVDFTFQVKTNGKVLKDALVSISSDDYSIHEVAYSDKNGYVSFAFYAADTTDLHIVITGKNLIAYEGLIKVTKFLGAETEKVSKINVWPNPFKNNISITTENGSTLIQLVELYDISGKLIFSQNQINSSRFSLNPPSLFSGIYILKVTNMDGDLSIIKLSH
ncbi:MAG: T9SS type A sorting domain-containing protein [Bacteroidetes bacterium]|nr:T9SS type A sorting domain-containing protein [Bacteroidota bacterium]